MTADPIRVEFPEKLSFLFRPAPYKVLYGGRDGIKSWSMARALLIRGAQYKQRWLCARETQQSIAESVHQLLEEQIPKLGLESCYRVEKARIVGTIPHEYGMYGTRKLDKPEYSEFVFAGLRHNVNQIKSFEALDGVWVEEAANVSKNSWEVVLPTIRKEGSEIWIGFNPELETDDTYKRWVLSPPPGAVVLKTSYLDNGWLSETSRARIEHMKATDPAGFANIYEGEPKTSVEGAIFGNEMKAALADGRIGAVPYNRARPVDTAWDLGFGDLTTIWFVQQYDGWYHFIDYLEGEGLTIADYLIQLQNRQYVYGTDWLPHDGVDTIIHRKLAGTGDRSMSIEMLMRQAGRRVRIAPKLMVADRINAARTVFPQCRFDMNKCADGLQALRHYQWGPPTKEGVRRREPLHNWASHGADGFQAAAVAIKAPVPKEAPRSQMPVQPPPLPGPYSPFG